MQFQREKLSPELFSEVLPLLSAHYREVAHYQDIEFDPDMEGYEKLEKAEMLRIFTCRDEGELVGYAVYMVSRNLHYKNSKQAHQDILYVKPEKRGVGHRLVRWADEQLRLEGVQVVAQHTKAKHNFGPMLEWLGYELMDHIYVRRLDG